MLNAGLDKFLDIQRPVHLEKNGRYRAKVSLNFLESSVDNDYIASLFEHYGFTKVIATGADEDRTVTGIWAKDDITVPMNDSHIVTIMKLA